MLVKYTSEVENYNMAAQKHFELKTDAVSGLHECEQERTTFNKSRISARWGGKIYYYIGTESLGTLYEFHSAAGICFIGIMDVGGSAMLHEHSEPPFHKLPCALGCKRGTVVSGAFRCR